MRIPALNLFATKPEQFFDPTVPFKLSQDNDSIQVKSMPLFPQAHHLAECHCHPNMWRKEASIDLRKTAENQFRLSLQSLKQQNKNPTLLDIGSGGLFQSLVLISIMLTQSFTASHIILVDPLFASEPKYMDQKLRALFEILEKCNVNKTIQTSLPQLQHLIQISDQPALTISIFSAFTDIPTESQKQITHTTAIDFYPSVPMSTLLEPIHHTLQADTVILSVMLSHITKEGLIASFPSSESFATDYQNTKKPDYSYEFLLKEWRAIVEKIDVTLPHAEMLKKLEQEIELCGSRKKNKLDVRSKTFLMDIIYRLHAIPYEIQVTTANILFPKNDSCVTPRREKPFGLSIQSNNQMNTPPSTHSTPEKTKSPGLFSHEKGMGTSLTFSNTPTSSLF